MAQRRTFAAFALVTGKVIVVDRVSRGLLALSFLTLRLSQSSSPDVNMH